jgi:small GTP-binding protein
MLQTPVLVSQQMKVVVVGDQFVGKTSFLSYLTQKRVPSDLAPTTSIYLTLHHVLLNGKTYNVNIWDTAGEEQYRSLASVYLRNARGVLVMFDLTRQGSFDSVDYWLNYISDTLDVAPAMLVLGNKSDLRESQAVDDNAIRTYCQWKEVKYLRTSAYTGENVDLSFLTLIETILSNEAAGAPQTVQIGDAEPPHRICC